MSVVICNGCEDNAIINIVKGKKVGTFFTKDDFMGTPVEVQAMDGNNHYYVLSSSHVIMCLQCMLVFSQFL